MERARIIIIHEKNQSEQIRVFKEDLLKEIENQDNIELIDLMFENKEEMLNKGRLLAELFFNTVVGLTTPNLMTQDQSFGIFAEDNRRLAESYVYVKMYGISDFPAIIVNNTVATVGKLPDITLVSSIISPKTLTEQPKDTLQPQVERQVYGQPVTPTEPEKPIRVLIQEETRNELNPIQAVQNPRLTERVEVQPVGAILDEQTKKNIVEILKRTSFRGPSECTNCLYYIESERRCALLHLNIRDPKAPLCHIKID